MPSALAALARPYVLGTGLDELERLGLQHRLWSDAAHGLWQRAKVNPGHRVLDVGAGPGYASFDLAQIVTHGGGATGQGGTVVAVDESTEFIAHLNEQADARGLPQLRGVVGDVERLSAALPGQEFSFDFAYARWIFCFVRDPEAVVAGVSRMLKKGGHLGVHDYFNYTFMTAVPKRASHDRVVQATAASWRAHGGDPDVCGRLPTLFAKHGMALVHVRVHQRVARPADSMFQWSDTWWKTYAPKLVVMGFLSERECEELFSDLEDIRRSSTDFILPPPVTEMLAVKL